MKNYANSLFFESTRLRNLKSASSASRNIRTKSLPAGSSASSDTVHSAIKLIHTLRFLPPRPANLRINRVITRTRNQRNAQPSRKQASSNASVPQLFLTLDSVQKMKIKHYPGKAVVNDPAWLEMDISNDIRGRQYEANWEDAQRNLSSTSSSGSNSWDKYSEGTLSSKLGQYQNMLDELAQEEQLYAVPKKEKMKYHSEKCLARINGNMANYYLPSQTKVQRSRSVKEEKPKPKPRYLVDARQSRYHLNPDVGLLYVLVNVEG